MRNRIKVTPTFLNSYLVHVDNKVYIADADRHTICIHRDKLIHRFILTIATTKY